MSNLQEENERLKDIMPELQEFFDEVKHER